MSRQSQNAQDTQETKISMLEPSRQPFQRLVHKTNIHTQRKTTLMIDQCFLYRRKRTRSMVSVCEIPKKNSPISIPAIIPSATPRIRKDPYATSGDSLTSKLNEITKARVSSWHACHHTQSTHNNHILQRYRRRLVRHTQRLISQLLQKSSKHGHKVLTG